MTTDMLVELAAALRVWFTVTMGLTGARSLYRENTHIDPHLVDHWSALTYIQV